MNREEKLEMEEKVRLIVQEAANKGQKVMAAFGSAFPDDTVHVSNHVVNNSWCSSSNKRKAE